MIEFFSYVGKGYEGEVTLSQLERIVPIILSFIIIALLTILGHHVNQWKHEGKLRKFLGIFLLVIWSSYFIWKIAHSQFNSQSLPISLCSLTTIGFIIVFLMDNKKMLDVVFYWGIVGGLLALLFANDVYRGIDHFRYYEFYLDHMLIFIAPFYYLFVRGYVPTLKSTLFSFISLFIAALLTLPVNLAYQMDYMIMNPYTAPVGTPAKLIADLVNENIILYILILIVLGSVVYVLLYLMTKLFRPFVKVSISK